MKFGYWFFYVLATALMICFTELNKQTLLGWILLLALVIAFPFLWKQWLSKSGAGMKLLGWVGYFAVFALIVAVSWPPVKRVPASKGHDLTGTVETAYGTVQGVYNGDHTVEIFAGIPYAKPPVGDLRWKSPQDPDGWDGVMVCDTFAPMSMQQVSLPVVDSLKQIIGYHDYKITLDDSYRPPVSEDSLYLNIWKPAGEQTGLPVLVYIHGGSLQTGQPWYQDYSGEGFAKDGVIAVNMGYRLGVFGFLADEELMEEEGTTGNYGLLDQIKALEWVRDHIACFGGDPDNVTIIGESAGSVCVDALCVSPLAKGLFRRAILESSTVSSPKPPHSFRLLSAAYASAQTLKEKYGVSSIQELRTLDAEKIVGEMNTQHHVTVDGTVLPDLPYRLRQAGKVNEEALLHGFNLEESGPFIILDHANLKNYETKIRGYFKEYADEILALYPAASDAEADAYWAEIYGAVFFNYPHDCLNRLMKDQEPVYEYRFSKHNGRLGCWHSGEMVYAFGVIPEDSGLYDQADRELSRIMHAYWVNFARTGDPNGEGLPEFETATEELLNFDQEVLRIENPYRKLYDILDHMQGFEEAS